MLSASTRVASALLALALLGAGCTVSTDSTTPVGRYSGDPTTNVNVQVDSYATTTPTTDTSSSSTVDVTVSSTTSTTPVVLPSPSFICGPKTVPKTKPMTNLSFPGILPAAQVDKKQICIKTNQGDLMIELDHTAGPRAASNFLSLAKAGFYDGTIFHRVIPGFMIQGGDPTGTGMGGPGYQFDNDPVNNLPSKELTMQGQKFTSAYYPDGTLAMANAGKDTNGSQFFLMVADYPLPPDYSVFGKVVQGLDVAKKISKLPTNSQDRPNEEVKMLSVTVQE